MQALCGSHIPASESAQCQWHALVQSAYTHTTLLEQTAQRPVGFTLCTSGACAFVPHMVLLGFLYLGEYTWETARGVISSYPSFLGLSLLHLLSICSSLPVVSCFPWPRPHMSYADTMLLFFLFFFFFCCHFSLVICHGWVPKVA